MRTIVLLLLFVCSPLKADYLQPKDFTNNTSPYKALVFLSHKCPCSRSHIEHMNKIVKEHKQLSLFGVISEPPSENEKELSDNYYQQSGFDFPIINDPQQILVKTYGALKTPHTTLLKKKGQDYETIYQGGLTNQKIFNEAGKHYLYENMVALSQGKELVYKKGFSLGCYIKRK